MRELGRDYALFWSARVLAVAGATVTAVAVPVLTFQRSGSPFLTATIVALQVLPYLVLGLVAGAIADRVSRRVLMVLSELVSAAALASLVLAGGDVAIAHLLVVATVVPTAFVWFDAAAFGALPALVGRERVVAANSALWTATTLVGVAGPALAGFTVAAGGPSLALVIDVVACAAAALLLAHVRTPMGPQRRTGARTRLRADMVEGLAFVLRHPVIRPLTLAGTLNSVAAGAVTGLVVVVAVRQLDDSATGEVPGLLLTAIAAGGFLAAVCLPRLLRVVRLGRVTVGALVGGAPALLLLALADTVAVAVIGLIGWGLATTLVVLNGISTRQQLTPDALQSRVNTSARMLAWGGTPFGALAAGASAEHVHLPVVLAGVAAVSLGAAVYAVAAGLPQVRLTAVAGS
ncbi:MAG: MFS transporter [Aeromicrobium sp.]|uniref:MFS transporter n=1 Tax=Aeromicrobium sp. TaxID=1871063 RepID=UPI0025BD0DA7|nr:MFS transporter [Aeromicrobium sp.]MCK5890506.1 MFS transporter [Aeromicrobium sp.]MDF1703520.1 MFS transporter [Aeromicrobium sp.]